MGLLELFITACVPVFNMLLVTGVGSFLASGFAGILNKEARKHLNNIVFYVFNPSLVAIYLAKTITMESLAKLWFMPVNILLAFTFGLIFGWIVIQVTKAPPKLRGLILGCCSAGNLGNIFLIIIPALCKEKGSPFGAPDVCQTYGLAYSSLSMAIGAVFLWSIVYNIVRVTSKAGQIDANASTNETKGSDSGTTAATVSEENGSGLTDHTNECTLPLISNPSIPCTETKVPLLERVKTFVSSSCGAVDLKKLFAPSTIAVWRSNSISHVDNGREPHHWATRRRERPAVGDRRRGGGEVRAASVAGHGAGEGGRPLRRHPAGPPVPVHPPAAVRRPAGDEHRDDHAAVRRRGERVLRHLRLGLHAGVRRRDALVGVLHVDTVVTRVPRRAAAGPAGEVAGARGEAYVCTVDRLDSLQKRRRKNQCRAITISLICTCTYCRPWQATDPCMHNNVRPSIAKSA